MTFLAIIPIADHQPAIGRRLDRDGGEILVVRLKEIGEMRSPITGAFGNKVFLIDAFAVDVAE